MRERVPEAGRDSSSSAAVFGFGRQFWHGTCFGVSELELPLSAAASNRVEPSIEKETGASAVYSTKYVEMTETRPAEKLASVDRIRSDRHRIAL